MTETLNTSRRSWGFSLAEVLAALMIGAMILVTVLTIYGRAEHSAASITHRLDSSRLPTEVLQRIAEDLDKIIASGPDIKVTVYNKFENLYPTAQLTITKTIYDRQDKPQKFEEIIWQTNYDYDANSLVLYRRHSGMALEDKLLEGDDQKDAWERELFVPICAGITFLRIQALRGESTQDRWTSASLPPGVRITISFARPFKTIRGTLDVPDSEKTIRTIAIDRTRKIKFQIAPKPQEANQGNENQRS